MAVIDAVTRKPHGHMELIIDGQRFLIYASLYRERPLQPGDEVDLEEFEQWLLLHQYRPALEYAVSLLAQRPCATGELKQKLQHAGYRPQTIEMVLYKLSSNDLVDDAEFARQWAASRTGRGLGNQRIARELQRKGVSREDVEAALEEIPEEEQLEAAEQLARKALTRAKAGEDPRKVNQRVLAMLARRGYGYDIAKRALRQAGTALDEEL